jgi:TPR repeat protein
VPKVTKRYAKSELERMFERASQQEKKGNLTSAFRLFLAAAKTGDSISQINVGNFYSDGIGIKPNQTRGLYWYRRAYRQGERCAASNIAVVFLHQHDIEQAVRWFERAVNLGDGDANLDIAKIYLSKNDRSKAIQYLRRTLRAKTEDLTEGSREEARYLLKRMQRLKGKTA